MSGPLTGLRIIELAAIGPVPFCGMLLAEMGADVIRVDRVAGGNALGELADVCGRGKRSIALDLKDAAGRQILVELAATADALVEGFRPGVTERLGIGPDDLRAVNPRLVYGRMTGWGQEGPLAPMAGHDINYIGLIGALHAIGGSDPQVPLNLVGDYAGGALYLLFGLLAALYEREQSGEGQVVEAAMIDGAASLMTPTYQLLAAGIWRDERLSNPLDGAAPFYRVYRTADGGHVAVGALEPQFFARMLQLLDLAGTAPASQLDRSTWSELEDRLAAAFATRTRDEWEEVFSGEDTCVTPVLSLDEAPRHEHNRARSTFVDTAGHPEPAPAPRFGRTPSSPTEPTVRGGATRELLSGLGWSEAAMADLADRGVVAMETP